MILVEAVGHSMGRPLDGRTHQDNKMVDHLAHHWETQMVQKREHAMDHLKEHLKEICWDFLWVHRKVQKKEHR